MKKTKKYEKMVLHLGDFYSGYIHSSFIYVTVKSKYTRNGIISFKKIDEIVKEFEPTLPEKDCVTLFRKLRKSGMGIYSVKVKLGNEECEYIGDNITDITW